MFHKQSLFSLLLLLFFLLSSCTLKVGENRSKDISERHTVDSQSVPDDRVSLKPGEIGPGDILDIKVYGDARLSGRYQVGPDGNIVFPLIGKISVSGHNIVSLSDDIAKRLSDGYLKNPQITLNIVTFVSNRIYVLGQVKKAGKFSMLDQMSVVEAISLAGGFTRYADITKVIVTRKNSDGREKRYNINIEHIIKGQEKNFYLKAGDIVFVSERFF